MLIDLLEEMKTELTSYATGKDVSAGFDNKKFRHIRKLVQKHPNLSSCFPETLQRCRNLTEFWPYIKGKFSTYQERRDFLASEFNPLIDLLEDTLPLIVGVYEKLEKLGEGGFGEVFKVRNSQIDLDFAVKFLSPVFQNNKERCLERFFQEAKILFTLRHRSIIQIYDLGIANSKPWIRMEYFEGKNLNQILKEFGKIAPQKVLVLIREIAEALNYAQKEAKIVHRDLKPSNIMVARPNKFRIIDFGLGAFIENELHSRITNTKIAWGGHYTAPELISNPELLTPNLDIYSIGAIWFHLITGSPPAGTSIKDQIEEIPEISNDYKKILEKCLKNATSRYSDFSELLEDLCLIEKEMLF